MRYRFCAKDVSHLGRDLEDLEDQCRHHDVYLRASATATHSEVLDAPSVVLSVSKLLLWHPGHDHFQCDNGWVVLG